MGGTGTDTGINVLDEWKANLPWLQGTATNLAEDKARRAWGNTNQAAMGQMGRSGLLGSGVSGGVARRQNENLQLRLQRARDLAKMSVTLPYLGAVERQAERDYEQRPRITYANTKNPSSLFGGGGNYTARVSGGTNLGRRFF